MSNVWQIIELFGVTNLSNLRVRAPFTFGWFLHYLWSLGFGLGVLYQPLLLNLAWLGQLDQKLEQKISWTGFSFNWIGIFFSKNKNWIGIWLWPKLCQTHLVCLSKSIFLTKFAQWPTCSTSHQITQSLVWINTRALLVAVVAAIHNLLSIFILNSTLLKAMEVFTLILLYLPQGIEFVRFCF